MNLTSVTVSSLIWDILMNANTGNNIAFVAADKNLCYPDCLYKGCAKLGVVNYVNSWCQVKWCVSSRMGSLNAPTRN